MGIEGVAKRYCAVLLSYGNMGMDGKISIENHEIVHESFNRGKSYVSLLCHGRTQTDNWARDALIDLGSGIFEGEDMLNDFAAELEGWEKQLDEMSLSKVVKIWPEMKPIADYFCDGDGASNGT